MILRLFVCLAVIFPTLAVAQTAVRPERLAPLRQELTRMVTQQEFAGINAVVWRGGETLLAESFGFQDAETKQPMRADTIFRAASLTKPVTAVAVMMLHEQGRFQLDDPVAKYLPAFAKMKVLAKENGLQTDVVDAESPITIRHLLTHTSGLFNSQGYNAANVFRPASPSQETMRKLAAIPLSHQPGRAWRYGSSYEVLASLVEVWSGQSFDVFLRTQLFEPLGMSDTGFHVPPAKRARIAKRYSWGAEKKLAPDTNQNTPAEPPVFFSGSGGLYSTIGDYLKFGRMLLAGGTWNGRALLKPATIELMHRNHVAPEVLPPDGPNGRVGYGMGLGFYVLMDRAKAKSVCPEGEVNATGAAATFLWIDRKNDLVGLFFMQRTPQSQDTLNHLKRIVYPALEL